MTDVVSYVADLIFIRLTPPLAVVIMVLNVVEIIAIAKRLRNKTPSNGQKKNVIPLMFLLNLAASDLLVGATLVVVYFIQYLLIWKVIVPTKALLLAYNIVLFVFLRVSLLTSVFNLMALTVDRLFTIRNAMVYRTKFLEKHALIVIAVSWVLSGAFIAAHFYIVYYSKLATWDYDLLFFPTIIFPATLVFGIGYWKIIKSVYAQGNEIRRLTAKENKNNNGNQERSTTEINSNIGSEVPPHILEREMKISVLAVKVVCAFIACWVPVAIIGVLILAGMIPRRDFRSREIRRLIINIGFYLAFINSVIDPIVYFGFKNKLFRDVKRRILDCCKKKPNRIEPKESHKKGESKQLMVGPINIESGSGGQSPAVSRKSAETTL